MNFLLSFVILFYSNLITSLNTPSGNDQFIEFHGFYTSDEESNEDNTKENSFDNNISFMQKRFKIRHKRRAHRNKTPDITEEASQTNTSKYNIDTKSAQSNIFPKNIFFLFRSPSECISTFDQQNKNLCDLPLMSSDDVSIEIQYECGHILMPPRMNKYKCNKIQVTLPDYTVDNIGFHLELKLFYYIDKVNIEDTLTTKEIIFSTLIEGVDDKKLNSSLTRHPFLEQLEIDNPPKKGEKNEIKTYIDFSLLRQKLISKSNGAYSIINSDSDPVKKAIDKIYQSSNYPLDEFYVLFDQNKDDQSVTFIVNAEPMIVPFAQIEKLVKELHPQNTLMSPKNIFYFKVENSLASLNLIKIK